MNLMRLTTSRIFHSSPNHLWCILIILNCMLLVSCSHYYYCPNSNNTPLLAENEAKINIQYAVTDAVDAIELQSAFAVSKHLGGMINFIAGGGDDHLAFFGSS